MISANKGELNYGRQSRLWWTVRRGDDAADAVTIVIQDPFGDSVGGEEVKEGGVHDSYDKHGTLNSGRIGHQVAAKKLYSVY